MSSTEVARTNQGSLAVRPDQHEFDQFQVAALTQLGISDASNADLAVFLHVCQRKGLDPFARQITMIARRTKNERDEWVTKQTIQTQIDGYRLIARRAADLAHESIEYDDTLWCGEDGVWTSAWTSREHPVLAKVVVLRNGKKFPATARWDAYVQTKRSGDPNAMWARMGAEQLAKCAEALALRKAFPEDLAGLYTDDEMGQADNSTPSVRVVQPASGADRMRDALGVPPQTEEPAPEPEFDEPTDSDETPGGASKAQLAKIGACMRDLGMTDRDMALDYVAAVIGHGIASRTELTKAEAHDVIERLTADMAGQAAAS